MASCIQCTEIHTNGAGGLLGHIQSNHAMSENCSWTRLGGCACPMCCSTWLLTKLSTVLAHVEAYAIVIQGLHFVEHARKFESLGGCTLPHSLPDTLHEHGDYAISPPSLVACVTPSTAVWCWPPTGSPRLGQRAYFHWRSALSDSKLGTCQRTLVSTSTNM